MELGRGWRQGVDFRTPRTEDSLGDNLWAEVPYVRFWTSTGALGSTSVNLAGYMMAILGYNTCP